MTVAISRDERPGRLFLWLALVSAPPPGQSTRNSRHNCTSRQKNDRNISHPKIRNKLSVVTAQTSRFKTDEPNALEDFSSGRKLLGRRGPTFEFVSSGFSAGLFKWLLEPFPCSQRDFLLAADLEHQKSSLPPESQRSELAQKRIHIVRPPRLHRDQDSSAARIYCSRLSCHSPAVNKASEISKKRKMWKPTTSGSNGKQTARADHCHSFGPVVRNLNDM